MLSYSLFEFVNLYVLDSFIVVYEKDSPNFLINKKLWYGERVRSVPFEKMNKESWQRGNFFVIDVNLIHCYLISVRCVDFIIYASHLVETASIETWHSDPLFTLRDVETAFDGKINCMKYILLRLEWNKSAKGNLFLFKWVYCSQLLEYFLTYALFLDLCWKHLSTLKYAPDHISRLIYIPEISSLPKSILNNCWPFMKKLTHLAKVRPFRSLNRAGKTNDLSFLISESW